MKDFYSLLQKLIGKNTKLFQNSPNYFKSPKTDLIINNINFKKETKIRKPAINRLSKYRFKQY